MATITIRRLDDDTVEALKSRARSSGRSMEEEVRLILAREARTGRVHGEAAVEHFRRFQRENFGDRVLSGDADILLGIREEDPTRWDGS